MRKKYFKTLIMELVLTANSNTEKREHISRFQFTLEYSLVNSSSQQAKKSYKNLPYFFLCNSKASQTVSFPSEREKWAPKPKTLITPDCTESCEDLAA